MRPLIFLFPDDRLDIGGNSAQARFLTICASFGSAKAAYYRKRVEGELHIDDVLAMYPVSDAGSPAAPIFVIHWGPDIADLLETLSQRDVIYVAHSTGWGMAMPPQVPILCVSRHSMAYWGRHAPNSYIAYLPNVVEPERSSEVEERDIDVLVQVRKSSRYLLDRLVPALRTQCNVTVLDGWVDDLSSWFRRSRVYLYDSLEHWADVGATEGFGLPPLEALGQGCVVFSSLNDALADYLDPGFNCRKIRVHSLAWDVTSILKAVHEGKAGAPTQELFRNYSAQQVSARLQVLLRDIEQFFSLTRFTDADIEDLWAARRPSPLQRARRAVRILAGT